MKKQKLPKVFKAKWLEALRSGKFKRTTGTMQEIIEEKDDKVTWGYCCLGVAERICGTSIETLGNDTLSYPYSLKEKSKVPKILRHDDKDDTGELTIVGKLANMNDSGKSFKQIANWIEKNL